MTHRAGSSFGPEQVLAGDSLWKTHERGRGFEPRSQNRAWMKRLFQIMGSDVTKPEPLWGRVLLVACLISLGYYTEKVFGVVLALNGY